jgi:DNA mismatch endonuclease (patch repair protein)
VHSPKPACRKTFTRRRSRKRRNKATCLRQLGGKLPDRLTPEQRSAHMRRIRKFNSGPELVVRRLVHGLGFRYRLYKRNLPGTPDLTFPSLRKTIFVNGCFWHQHNGCRLARPPKTRLEYWLPKLARTTERDALSLSALSALGWSALVIWECETEQPVLLREKIEGFLTTGSPGRS